MSIAVTVESWKCMDQNHLDQNDFNAQFSHYSWVELPEILLAEPMMINSDIPGGLRVSLSLHTHTHFAK